MARAAIVEYQNLILRSEAFDNASWTKVNCSVTADATAGPFSGTLADAIKEDASLAGHLMMQGTGIAANDYDYVSCSVWVKAGVRTFFCLTCNGQADGAYFNLGTAAVGTLIGNATAEIHVADDRDWARCCITSIRRTGAFNEIELALASADGVQSFQGVNGQTAVYLWGAQYTMANWAGPYVATAGATVSTGQIRNRP